MYDKTNLIFYVSGTSVDSDGIHLGESNQNKTAALLKLNSGAVTGLGNGRSNKPRPRTGHLGDFEKGSNPIDDSVLDRIHSDFMKSPGFYLGSAHMSDVFVSNMSARLSFGSGSAYESDLSSSTVHYSGSDPGSSYGSDIPFLAEIAVDTEYAHGFDLPTTTRTAWGPQTILDRPRGGTPSHPDRASRRLSLETTTTHGCGIPRSTDTVCLSYDTRFALESNFRVSKKIPPEPKTTHGSEKPSSTNTECLSSEPEIPYESDSVDSTDSAFLPCEPEPAYASAVPFLTETRCLQFDCDTANETDIPFSATETLFSFGPAYESDVLDLTESACPPSELEHAYASDDAFATEIRSEPETAYGSKILSWTDTVCVSSDLETAC
eukprot:SAG31_NODE_1250_length_9118_cov_4.047344_1_plen_378_part_10